MSVTSLKELDAKAPADKDLLDLFQRSREYVLGVTASHLMPNNLAVTTANGFIELIDTSNGEFRLFLAHLDRIPLDATLRCFSLVPSYFHGVGAGDEDKGFRGGRAGGCGGPFLAFSLSYSNELLLADLATGRTAVLTAFTARPQSIFCDGDYLVCGDGGGHIAAWRANAGVAWGTGIVAPTRLWHRRVFDDAVTVLRVHRDELICGSADYQCLVLSMDTGLMTSRVAREPSPLVAAMPLVKPLVQASVVALCSVSRISVYTEPTEEGPGARGLPGASGPVPSWDVKGSLTVDVDVRCATCCGSFLATGTASGVVLLFRCNAVSGEVEELVRFDVGHGVVGLQLYADESLVVVTGAGDVWKWPVQDLLDGAEEEEESRARGLQSESAAPLCLFESTNTEEVEDEPRPSTEPPKPTDMQRPPAVDCTAVPDGENTSTHSSDAIGEREEHSTTQQGGEPDPQHVSLSSEDTAAQSIHDAAWADASVEASGVATQPQLLEQPVAFTRTDGELAAVVATAEMCDTLMKKKGVEVASGAFMEPVAQLPRPLRDGEEQVQKEEPGQGVGVDGVPSSGDTSKLTTSSSTLTSRAASSETPSSSPSAKAAAAAATASASTADAAAAATGAEQSPPSQQRMGASCGSVRAPLTANPKKTSSLRSTPAPMDLVVEPHMAAYRARQLAEIEQVLGAPPPAVISGLRTGKRMDPRKIAQTLESEAINGELEAGDAEDGADELSCLPSPQLQSTALLLEQKAALGAATFDFDAYAREHPLEVMALPYQHPIRPVRYALEDRVFEAVTRDHEPRIKGRSETAPLEIGEDPLPQGDSDGDERAVVGCDPGGLRGPPRTEVKDDLMDATHGRFVRRVDRKWEEERRRKGPNIREHPCSDLMFLPPDPSETVLFKEYQLKPSNPQLRLLPMPLPPTPSVF